jgi:hypothetical protein
LNDSTGFSKDTSGDSAKAASDEIESSEKVASKEEPLEKDAIAPGFGLGRAAGVGLGRSVGGIGTALVGALQNLLESTTDETLKAKISDLLNYINTNGIKTSSDETESIKGEETDIKTAGDEVNREDLDVAVVKLASNLGNIVIEAFKPLYDEMTESKLASEDILGTLLASPNFLDIVADYNREKVASENAVSIGTILKVAASDPALDYLVKAFAFSKLATAEELPGYWNNVIKVADDDGIEITDNTIAIANELARVFVRE